jgi:hypothetical protein
MFAITLGGLLASNLVLINFNVPTKLKVEFDRACKGRNLARTSVLIGLIEQFVEDDALRSNRVDSVEEDDLPVRLFSTEWEHF